MSSPQHEPTMEEILASIRKIISEDSPESQPAAQAEPASEVKDAPEAEVLDLTHEVHEEPPPVVAVAPVPVAAAPVAAAPVVEAPAPVPVQAADDVVFETIEEATVSSQAQAPLHSSEGIFSDKTRKALNDAFAEMAPQPAPKMPEQLPSMNGLSLEAVFQQAVRETFDPVLDKWLGDNTESIIARMKPMISDWLDEHLPAMLEDALHAAKNRPRR